MCDDPKCVACKEEAFADALSEAIELGEEFTELGKEALAAPTEVGFALAAIKLIAETDMAISMMRSARERIEQLRDELQDNRPEIPPVDCLVGEDNPQ